MQTDKESIHDKKKFFHEKANAKNVQDFWNRKFALFQIKYTKSEQKERRLWLQKKNLNLLFQKQQFLVMKKYNGPRRGYLK